MSSLYNLEPQPTAKVVLQTTAGDLSLELFAKQTPLASRNFLQHCLDGYYNNTIFHRLVPGFIVQGGDPTGTGSGGISAINNGEPFHDEFHSRLKFNRRGLLGMANEGKDSNASQFFLTLGTTPELQGQNTLFGRIEGDTIYNLMKMAEAEMAEGQGSERPLYPTRITGAEILVNPFDDMVARVREAPRTKAEGPKKDVRKRKKPVAKNVLSFADAEGDGDVAAPVMKKAKANPKLVVVEEQEPERVSRLAKAKPREKPEVKASPELVEPEVRSSIQVTARTRQPQDENKREGDDDNEDSDMDDSSGAEQATTRRRALDKTNAEIEALKASMKRGIDVMPAKVKEKPKSALEAMVPSNSTRGRKRGKGGDEHGALDIFKAFKQRLEELPIDEGPEPDSAVRRGEADATVRQSAAPTTSEPVEEEEEADLCDLHFIVNCQSCRSWDEEKPDGEANADGDDDPGWMGHTLRFTKDTLGKDLEWKRKMAEIEVIDPREKARAIKEEKWKNGDKKKR